MRRSRLIAYLIALVTLLSGALIVAPSGAEADTADPDIADEGWFARSKPSVPPVDLPCVPTVHERQPAPPVGCGPVGVPASPTPQAKATGAYVVASTGGDAGDDADTGADTGWAAFNWVVFEQAGATVTKFEVSIAQLSDNNGFNNGDTWTTGQMGTDGKPAPPPAIQACNILEGWGAEPGSNPWDARPTDGAACVAPKSVGTVPVTGTTRQTAVFTFDVTTLAQTWVDGTGYGFVIKPGAPGARRVEGAFQLTFSGYYDPGTSSSECNSPTDIPTRPCTTTPRNVPPPKVVFEYTPAVEEDIDDDDLGSIDTGSNEFLEDITTTTGDEGVLEAIPDIDIIPTDEGSEPLIDDIPPPVDEAPSVDIGERRTTPISRETGFPWIVLLLLPLAVVAFWGTGTALGPVGDPVPARRGGVSRVLAQRQAAHGGSDLTPRY